MSVLKRLAWIAAGYAASAAVAAALVAARYLFIDPAIVNASSGMFAGGDLILGTLIAGTLGLVPTFFLLRLASAEYPRVLGATLLALGATGPACLWLTATFSSKRLPVPAEFEQVAGLALVFFVFPRVVALPIVFAGMAIAAVLIRDARARLMALGGLILEGLALGAVVLHFAREFLPRD